MSKYKKRYTKIDMLKLKSKFTNRCFECGLCQKPLEELQFAHLKPTKLSGMGRGLQKRYFDIKNNPDSYYLCCKDKHSEIDNKKYV